MWRLGIEGEIYYSYVYVNIYTVCSGFRLHLNLAVTRAVSSRVSTAATRLRSLVSFIGFLLHLMSLGRILLMEWK
jgi:hypothetical protein